MMRILRARGIAAASLALVSSNAFAAPPGDLGVNADPLPGFAAHSTLSVGVDDTLDDLPGPVARTPFARPVSPRTTATSSLEDLVRAFPGRGAPNAERACLAGAVYFEARGEPLEGQLAVAEVVLNRAASGKYPRSICGVVKQPWQFSFVHDGQFPRIDEGSEAWRRAEAIAYIAAENLADKLSSDVLWYHAHYVAPSWGRRLDRVTQIGAHIFYRLG